MPRPRLLLGCFAVNKKAYFIVGDLAQSAFDVQFLSALFKIRDLALHKKGRQFRMAGQDLHLARGPRQDYAADRGIHDLAFLCNDS